MTDQDLLVRRFEEHRDRLRAVAYRMLGSVGEADDAIQETWMRFARTDTGDVRNLRAWLTTVTSRVCLTMLESRRSRRETPFDDRDRDAPAEPAEVADPEREAVMADSVGRAMLVVLDTLSPPERLAFVLHDMFAVPFDRIAPIVQRTPEAARQLASRARRRVRGAAPIPDAARQKAVVEAFLAAAREGRFEDLLELLDPEITVRADEAAVETGFTAGEVTGAKAAAEIFLGRAAAAVPVLIDGDAGAMWAPGGSPRSVISFTIEGGRVTGIEIAADPASIDRLELIAFDD